MPKHTGCPSHSSHPTPLIRQFHYEELVGRVRQKHIWQMGRRALLRARWNKISSLTRVNDGRFVVVKSCTQICCVAEVATSLVSGQIIVHQIQTQGVARVFHFFRFCCLHGFRGTGRARCPPAQRVRQARLGHWMAESLMERAMGLVLNQCKGRALG